MKPYNRLSWAAGCRLLWSMSLLGAVVLVGSCKRSTRVSLSDKLNMRAEPYVERIERAGFTVEEKKFLRSDGMLQIFFRSSSSDSKEALLKRVETTFPDYRKLRRTSENEHFHYQFRSPYRPMVWVSLALVTPEVGKPLSESPYAKTEKGELVLLLTVGGLQ